VDELIAELTRFLGPESVLTGAEARERMPAGSEAALLLLPRTTEQVSRALSLCHAAGRSVVPQGGLTGLVRGAVSGPGEVALSLDRMRSIEEVDTINRSMTVQAGVPLQAAQEAAAEVGLMLPLDLGARGTATIGGNVSTNAGGTRVLRFGMMREMVLGLEAVLADGTVVDARSKIIKNNAGYDVKQLFIGSEGTLGIVTRVVLRLRPLPRSQSTALVAIDDFKHVAQFLSVMEARLLCSLSSFEVMWRSFYELVTTPPAKGSAVLPRGHGYYVLVETMGGDQARDDEGLVAALEEASAKGLFADAVVAQSSAQRRELWSLREDLDQLGREGPVFAYDVSLSLDAMEAYVAEVERRLSARFGEHRAYVFGHIGDGNLHLSVGVHEDGAHDDVDAIVYGALSADDSSVSAEHGIGLLKKRHLSLSRNEAELFMMRALKQALDPQGILNPGKIFDVPGRAGQAQVSHFPGGGTRRSNP
jgi:FAD/FMN-containing dehydrogenase